MAGGIHPPPQVLASWPKPNYVNPETRSYGLVILTSILGFAVLVITVLRLWTRAVITRNFGIDDWLIIAATPVVLGMDVAFGLASKRYYFDRHIWDVPFPTGAVETRKIALVIELSYIWAVSLVKISILLFYKRMSKGIFRGWVDWIVYGSVAFVAAFTITFTFIIFFKCRPFVAYWQQVNPYWTATHEYSCIDEGVGYITACAVSIVQDFLVAAIPTFIFARMDIPVRQKFAMIVVFAIGFFLCITGILRCIYIQRVFYESYDTTWAADPAWYWTSVEVNVGTIIASVPALKIFIQRHLESIKSTRRYDYGRSAGDTTRQGGTSGRGGTSRISAPLHRLSARLSGRATENAWAWNRTPSEPEVEAYQDYRGRTAVPLERINTKASTSQRERAETPEEHARRITPADFDDETSRAPTSPNSPLSPGQRHRRQDTHWALNSHPISPPVSPRSPVSPESFHTPTSPHSPRDLQQAYLPYDKRGTWLSNMTTGYTASVTASGSQSDNTDGKTGGFDPDAHALPILTEQESRDMGLIGIAQ